MLFRFRTIALSLFSLLLCFGLTACQKNVAPHPLEGRNLSVGVAPFVQTADQSGSAGRIHS